MTLSVEDRYRKPFTPPFNLYYHFLRPSPKSPVQPISSLPLTNHLTHRPSSRPHQSSPSLRNKHSAHRTASYSTLATNPKPDTRSPHLPNLPPAYPHKRPTRAHFPPVSGSKLRATCHPFHCVHSIGTPFKPMCAALPSSWRISHD
ncbi:hypothetical protein CC80DRAFT_164146 [Byssothecium circinans]|uniref:Uncharacterized protein n=1 Tax=Byssothecium circinans TaxID=147558 RepID=A0A6A5TQB4_9PLEO|nr:hypothetical protein CC80DRAFT_164146 [Byssothecium circinans]